MFRFLGVCLLFYVAWSLYCGEVMNRPGFLGGSEP
jgi:hypothetical protein